MAELTPARGRTPSCRDSTPGYAASIADGPTYVPRLPEHPDLREIALAAEEAEMAADILDSSFRTVFLASESARILGLSAAEAESLYGHSQLHRSLRASAEFVRVSEESGTRWFQHNAPIMRSFLEPDDPAFAEAFGPTAAIAAEIDPLPDPPSGWTDKLCARLGTRMRANLSSDWFGLDPDTIAYTPLGELPGVSQKAIRDAGAIALAQI